MPNTMTLIASSTVGAGGAANIDFTSIPSTYTDLYIKLSGRDARNDGIKFDNTNMRFNGSSTSYSGKLLYGWPATSASGLSADGGTDSISFIYVTSTQALANTFGNIDIYIPNYAGSTYKSVSIDSVTENDSNNAIVGLAAGLWSNTSAITSISLFGGSNWLQYTSAYLYGIIKS